jgi:DNA-binding XRE family transcriptional regulator
MFSHIVNTVFNNTLFNCPIIPAMHEQMKRLYAAAKNLRDVEGQSAVAKLLNVSPQTINNWEARGISNEGLLKAQEVIGCDAIWVRDGGRPMTKEGGGAQPAPLSLDMDNLKNAINAAIEIDRKGGLNLTPEKMAVLITYWYDEWSEKGQHIPSLSEANRILRLVA